MYTTNAIPEISGWYTIKVNGKFAPFMWNEHNKFWAGMDGKTYKPEEIEGWVDPYKVTPPVEKTKWFFHQGYYCFLVHVRGQVYMSIFDGKRYNNPKHSFLPVTQPDLIEEFNILLNWESSKNAFNALLERELLWEKI